MPIPGPRNQFGPAPGYRNPDGASPDFFNMWKRPGPVYWPGRSPGLMAITLRGCVMGAGQIRRLWRQSVGLIPAQGPYSWSTNEVDGSAGAPVGITRALRYLTQSTYTGAGIDNSRYAALHTVVRKENFYKTITQGSGRRNPPTVRNRMTSFGSRVPTLNQAVAGAEAQQPGQGTQ
jgi:hypothetical protein